MLTRGCQGQLEPTEDRLTTTIPGREPANTSLLAFSVANRVFEYSFARKGVLKPGAHMSEQAFFLPLGDLLTLSVVMSSDRHSQDESPWDSPNACYCLGI